MNEGDVSTQIRLRIPGAWVNPGELIQRLPRGYRLSPDSLFLPDGTEIEFVPMRADEQFFSIFQSACRRPAKDEELETISRYTVNVCLSGPAGSMDAALAMMQAGAAILKAGGAGVFIDNSALAHGGSDWQAMTDDGSPDAISFAFTSIMRDTQETCTMGMHVMGYPDLLMKSSDIDEEGEAIINIIRYVCGGDKPIGVGHILADEFGPRFQIMAKVDDEFEADSPMHNPYGRLKIVSAAEVAEGN